jgi:hypothetical protein
MVGTCCGRRMDDTTFEVFEGKDLRSVRHISVGKCALERLCSALLPRSTSHSSSEWWVVLNAVIAGNGNMTVGLDGSFLVAVCGRVGIPRTVG